MHGPGQDAAKPQLKEVVAEASQALARLDALRLEELALACSVLNRNLGSMTLQERRDMKRQAREAAPDMAVLARVLEATRANRNVMNRLRAMREGRLEYSERQARGGTDAEVELGDD